MKKVVYYDGQKYHITFQAYGYDSSRFAVNGESASYVLNNRELLELDMFKSYTKKSIEEYIERAKLQETFKNWDGKL